MAMDSDSQFGGTPPGTTLSGGKQDPDLNSNGSYRIPNSMRPTPGEIVDRHMALDITAPQHVEIEYDAKRKVLYVHMDGITVLRACRVGVLNLNLNSIAGPLKGDNNEPGTPVRQG